MAAITAQSVKELREATGAGMMDCKKALNENDGDFQKSLDWLREKGIAKAAKREGRVAAEGSVASYIHMGGKIGVLVEVNCETDFVARGEDFQGLCRDICMHISFANPRWVTREEVPEQAIEAERKIYVAQALETGKPEEVCKKIADGKLNKWYEEVCLMDQPSIHPKHEGKKISDLATALSGKCGEKITVRRFVRYELGEGIERQQSDLAADVAAELAKAEAKAKG